MPAFSNCQNTTTLCCNDSLDLISPWKHDRREGEVTSSRWVAGRRPGWEQLLGISSNPGISPGSPQSEWQKPPPNQLGWKRGLLGNTGLASGVWHGKGSGAAGFPGEQESTAPAPLDSAPVLWSRQPCSILQSNWPGICPAPSADTLDREAAVGSGSVNSDSSWEYRLDPWTLTQICWGLVTGQGSQV